MVPLIVLGVAFPVLLAIGQFVPEEGFGWWDALRWSLAAMFLVTASAHWGKRRADLVRMVPPYLPNPEALVTLTGLLEILGAAGLVLPIAPRLAAGCLAALLAAMFPANVYAARKRLTVGGRAVPGLWPRAAMQAVFVAAALAVALGS